MTARALLWLVSVCGLGALLPFAAAAEGPRGEGGYDRDEPRVAAALLVDAETVAPGEKVRVGVHFTLDPDWHIYWRNAGDAGAATRLTWDVPGAEVGPTQWPAPTVFRETEVLLVTYGYTGDVLLASDAVFAPDAFGPTRIDVDAEFVVCKIDCIPGRIALSREIIVAAPGQPPSEEVRRPFDEAALRVPNRPDALGLFVAARLGPSAVRPGDNFELALDVVSCVDADTDDCVPWRLDATLNDEAFVPEALPTVRLAARGLGRPPTADPGFSLIVEGHAFDDPGVETQPLRGVIPIVRGTDRTFVEIDVALPRAPAEAAITPAALGGFEVVAALEEPRAASHDARDAAGATDPATPSLALALLFALIGGLVLNLMPCVLPVLAIKVFGVAEIAHADRATLVRHGVAYLAGVLASMAALAGVVVALRAAGTSVGWGFQFQEPVFLAAICTLLVVFAMNLFGVFEVTWQPSGPASAPAVGPPTTQRSFFEGTLAVVLATPCTAPFLGTAVGFAFAGSTTVIFAIFLAIGFGLAAPYVLITFVPGLARFVPRPGAWMLRVRSVLGFTLLAAAAWLLWVMGRAVGVDGQGLLLAYLVGVAFLVWVFGTLQAGPRTTAARVAAASIAAFVVAALALLPLDPAPVEAVEVADASAGGPAGTWSRWAPTAIDRERAAGRPVFVEFTADWCITCKVNESVVLSTDAVRQELTRLDFATFKADWTLRDEEIGRALAEWGRAGVPMYLVYPADTAQRPMLLPELLTVETTVEALRAAGQGEGV